MGACGIHHAITGDSCFPVPREKSFSRVFLWQKMMDCLVFPKKNVDFPHALWEDEPCIFSR